MIIIRMTPANSYIIIVTVSMHSHLWVGPPSNEQDVVVWRMDSQPILT